MTRSQMMAGIGSKDTKPELIIRHGLHSMGFRFRLHKKSLPGKPDLVLAKFKTAIFIHGCFWHAHEGCRYFSLPKTRTDFWDAKLKRNTERDKESASRLISSGWRVLTVWECATRNVPSQDLCKKIAKWLHGNAVLGEISERDLIA